MEHWWERDVVKLGHVVVCAVIQGKSTAASRDDATTRRLKTKNLKILLKPEMSDLFIRIKAFRCVVEPSREDGLDCNDLPIAAVQNKLLRSPRDKYGDLSLSTQGSHHRLRFTLANTSQIAIIRS